MKPRTLLMALLLLLCSFSRCHKEPADALDADGHTMTTVASLEREAESLRVALVRKMKEAEKDSITRERRTPKIRQSPVPIRASDPVNW